MSSLQIHIPISPTKSFFTMIQYFAAGLRQYGGRFADAPLIVSIGGDCEPFDVVAAQPHLARYGITWRWVHREHFRRYSYNATTSDRWAAPFQSDFVLMADADLLILNDFSDVAEQLSQPLGIAGVEATYPPWLVRNKGDVDRERWGELFKLAELPPPIFDCPHPGYGLYYPIGGGMEAGPVYYNFGFVLGTRHAMNAIAKTFYDDYVLAKKFMQTDLAAQVGLTLSIVRNALDYRVLPVRYNFWPEHKHYEAFPADAADMRILHYFSGPFRKHQDNGSISDVAAWLHAHRGDESPHAQFISRAVSRAHAAVMAQLTD